MEKQPVEIQTLYVELLERLVALEAGRAIGHLPGTFVTKNLKGHDYYYFQHLDPGGAKRQTYVGKKDEVLDVIIDRFKQSRRDVAEDQAGVQRLCSLLRAGGAITADAASGRVLKALADSGVFRLGGVLVGTQAFAALGNVLGVRWRGAAIRTQDVDIAAAKTMSIAVPAIEADIPGALESLEMGFLPIPGLDPASPSTSFKVRGQGLRVDLLTPAGRRGRGPVPVARFKAAAQPLRYLDLLTEVTIRGVVIDGGSVLVNLPDPARFAFHKLIVAGERPPAMHAKRQKDLWQAAQLLEVLLEERPGDIDLAWQAIVTRGLGWQKRVHTGLSGIEQLVPQLAVHIEVLTRLR